MTDRRQWVERGLAIGLAAGLSVIAFVYGVVAVELRLFPYAPVLQAAKAANAYYIAAAGATDHYQRATPAMPAGGGAVTHDRAAAAPGVTLIGGYTQDGFKAWLVDLDGQKLHEWRIKFSEAFPEAPQLVWKADDADIVWHGMYLLPNGDLMLNFQDSSFPYGNGLVRIDKDSKLVWALPRNTHHAIARAEDGNFWVPSLHYRPQGVPDAPNFLGGLMEDTLLKVSPDGKVLAEISILGAFKTVPGPLKVTYRDASRARSLLIEAEDPLHLNSVMELPTAWAAAFPMFQAGDLLVSLRNANLLAVIDPRRKRVRWSLLGSFVRQHDAQFLANGHLLLFDNLGGAQGCGSGGPDRSRVLEIDPQTQQLLWSYGCGEPPIYSNERGMTQVLANGNVLIVETQNGHLLEVTHDPAPRIVWEYFNGIGEAAGVPSVGLITYAQRLPREALPFLGEPKG